MRAGEVQLPDTPTALAAFLPSAAQPRMPLLAVATGPQLYLYRGLQPHGHFTVPELDAEGAAAAPAHEAPSGGACVTCMATVRQTTSDEVLPEPGCQQVMQAYCPMGQSIHEA